MVAQQIQRLKKLEALYYTLGSTEGEPPNGELAGDAIAKDGGASVAEWASAAHMSVDELRLALREGVSARSTIVECNMGLVVFLVNKQVSSSGGRLDPGTTYADLMQEGCLALLNAAERFDFSLGVRFSTYATFVVRGAIRSCIQQKTRLVRLPQNIHRMYNQIMEVQRNLGSQNDNWEVSAEAIAAELVARGKATTKEKVIEVIKLVRSRPMSMDIYDLDGMPYSEKKSSIRDIELSEIRGKLDAFMAECLTTNESTVLRLRFGIDDGEQLTARQVAEISGFPFAVTKSYLNSAFRKLRQPGVSYKLRDFLGIDD